jgi:mannose-6-phosphate isomerase-like protein (cupin superfamily)
MPPLTVAPQVVDAGEVPARAAQDGSLRERRTVGPGTGFDRLEQTVIECAPGASSRRAAGAAEEVLFVLQGSGTLELAGASHALEPETGAYLAPDEEYELRNIGSEPLKIVAVRIPAP